MSSTLENYVTLIKKFDKQLYNYFYLEEEEEKREGGRYKISRELLSSLNKPEAIKPLANSLDSVGPLNACRNCVSHTSELGKEEQKVLYSLCVLSITNDIYYLVESDRSNDKDYYCRGIALLCLELCFYLKPWTHCLDNVMDYISSLFQYLVEKTYEKNLLSDPKDEWQKDLQMSFFVLASHCLCHTHLRKEFISLFQHQNDANRRSFSIRWKTLMARTNVIISTPNQNGGESQTPLAIVERSNFYGYSINNNNTVREKDDELVRFYHVVCGNVQQYLEDINSNIKFAIECENAYFGLTAALHDPNYIIPQVESSLFLANTGPKACQMLLLTMTTSESFPQILALCDNNSSLISHKVRDLLKLTLKGVFEYPISATLSLEIGSQISKLLNLPDTIFENLPLNRTHYDILFESVDNSTHVLDDEKFTSLVCLSAGALANMEPNNESILEYNKSISELNPPLSAIAIPCYLEYGICFHLCQKRGARELKEPLRTLEIFEYIFSIPHPPIPIRRFSQFHETRGQMLSGENNNNATYLGKSLLSLLKVIFGNLKLMSNMGDTSMDIDSQNNISMSCGTAKMVTAILFIISEMVQQGEVNDENKEYCNYLIERCFSYMLLAFPRTGFATFVSTVFELSQKSIALTGIGIQFLTLVLSYGPVEVIEQNIAKCKHIVLRLLKLWYQTNSLIMDKLIAQLKRFNQGDLVSKASPKASNIGVIGKLPEQPLRSSTRPVHLDLSCFTGSENKTPILIPAEPVKKKINTSQSQPNLKHTTNSFT